MGTHGTVSGAASGLTFSVLAPTTASAVSPHTSAASAMTSSKVAGGAVASSNMPIAMKYSTPASAVNTTCEGPMKMPQPSSSHAMLDDASPQTVRTPIAVSSAALPQTPATNVPAAGAVKRT